MIAPVDAQTLHARTVSDVQDAMRDAIATRNPIRISGAHTWRDAGAPIDAHRTLSLRDLSGVIDYVPGDLTLTAFAGTSLAELSHATAAHGQWLGLDPAGDRLGTIGATIATASCGPLSHAFGTPRDLVLGIEAVTGYGDLVRPGGRVVKNVAGFDLVRLYTGSSGVLGPITSLTLRLRALPIHDVTVAIELHEASQLATLLEGLRRNTLSPAACEWVDGDTARRIGVSVGADVLLVRFGGNAAFVRGQESAIQALSPCSGVDPVVWGALAQLDRDASAVVRVSGAAATLPERIVRLRSALSTTGVRFAMHASVGRGVVRVVTTGAADAAQVVLQTIAVGETHIPEKLPIGWWETEPDPFRTGLSERVRAAFDPYVLCNRRVVPDA